MQGAGEYCSLTVNAPHLKDWNGFLSQWCHVLGGLSEIQLASIQVILPIHCTLQKHYNSTLKCYSCQILPTHSHVCHHEWSMCTASMFINFGLHTDSPHRPLQTWTDDKFYVIRTLVATRM